MRSISEDVQVKIRNRDAIRPWQHVLDPLSGYLLLAEKMWLNGDKFAESWNFGPIEESKSVSWIIQKISELYGKKCNTSFDTTQNPHETKSLKLDCTKAYERLGWIPKTNLEQGLQMTVDWYKHYEKHDDMRKFTEKQIDDFTLM